MYDAIVVGARVGGSPTAMLLAQRGYRVLIVDRARFPSDTISTHFMHPRGCSYLSRWGLLDRVRATTPSWSRVHQTREGITIAGTQPLKALRQRLGRLNNDDGSYAAQVWCAPRRTVFDKLLLDAAVEAGAELLEGCTVEELLFDGERVLGIRGRLKRGGPVTAKARMVIGADGRHSFLAKALKLEKYNVRPRCTFAYYSYWSGFSQESHLQLRGRFGISSYPTNDGLQHLVVFGPDQWFREFRADVERNLHWIIAFVAPDVAEMVRDGRREERIYGAVDLPAFFHKPYGPGWALVGDAGYNVDQCTAIGMTHAVRDAQLLADAVHAWLSGQRPWEEALNDYATRRDEDAAGHYEQVCAIAEMHPLRLEQLRLVASIRDNQPAVDRMLGVTGEVVPVAEFYTPENIARLTEHAADATDEYPIFHNYEAAVQRYRVNPFSRD